MDAKDMEKLEQTWAKYYTAKYHGREGRIKALNQLSATAQFEWMVKNADCFCRDCVATMQRVIVCTWIGLTSLVPIQNRK